MDKNIKANKIYHFMMNEYNNWPPVANASDLMEYCEKETIEKLIIKFKLPKNWKPKEKFIRKEKKKQIKKKIRWEEKYLFYNDFIIARTYPTHIDGDNSFLFFEKEHSWHEDDKKAKEFIEIKLKEFCKNIEEFYGKSHKNKKGSISSS